MSREKECFRDTLERLISLFPGKEVLTFEETAKYLRVDEDTLRAWIYNGEFTPAKKQGRKWIIPIIKFANFLS